MNQTLVVIIALLAAYLLGSIPSAYIAGRLKKGIDIRQVGSRNMGAMNSIYNLGLAYGMTVLVVDVVKGSAAVGLARWLGAPVFNDPMLLEMAAGVVAVLGHNFPVWLRFKGGKGGATAIGAIVFLMPWCIPVGLACFAVFLAITKVPTISYGLAMLSFPFVAWLIYDNVPYIIYSALLILVPFVSYIPRLIEMRRKGGSWKRVFSRKSVKDRF
jgi:glycerol-3-phosphate acyltransferase PlsY